MATQTQAKQVQKSQGSSEGKVQRAKAKRQLKRKSTNIAPAYLQAKLNISTPEDSHEREADQVADNVMRMPTQKTAEGADRKINRASLKPGITPLNRAIAREILRDSLKSGEMAIERASLKPGEQLIQRQADGDAPASDKTENRINAKRGQGDKLPDAVRSDMETRFGRDFSAVRIHTDKDASEMSSDIEAKAFTVGNDIFFGNGRFDANSDEGRRLLAHELTHVAQQQQTSETEQDEQQTVSRSENKANRWSLGSWLADKAWSILKRVAPSGLYTLVRGVYENKNGIFGYLKEKIGNAVSSIFSGLKRGADVLGNFFASFGNMAKAAKDIVKALASGNCKPLFAAVKQLKDTLGAAVGDAWKAIKGFFKPIGTFFTDLWASWGAPVLDWLKKTAGSVWTWLKNLGKTLWSWTKPVRDYASSAWKWLKGKLGLGGGSGGQGDSEGGIMGWIKDKAQSAWMSVKAFFDPVIKPVKKFAAKVMDFLPIKAILNLRETVQGWLKNAGQMGQAMGDDGAGVAKQQISLREQILPAVIKTMKSVRSSLTSTGLWLSEKIGGVVTEFSTFMTGLRSNSVLKYVASMLSWVEKGITSLGSWAKDTVQSLFNFLGDGLVKLAEFIEPVLNTLKQVADTILNLLGKLPGLILGPVWNAIPKCIRDPLKDFVLNQILGRIPFFKQLIAVKDAWEQIKATGLLILKQVFVDGNLLGALWTLFKAILKIFKLPVKLIRNILIKGVQSLGAIIAAPLDFLMNILRAIKLGFTNFFSNIFTYLLDGAMDWLFGAVAKAGLTAPVDFSLKSIFSFVMDVLGLTIELVWKKLEEKIGEAKVKKLKKMIQYASGALEWIKVIISEGPSALWEKLKEKLSDLWNMVLNGVIEWINTKVIAWASRWLISLLDVTGIMPIINATIAIYKAIESFMEHIKAMLKIVNSVLNGIADMAVGAIESAAKFLEDALAATIPIVIGFLANQAGLGNIAEKIKEILGKIQLKVEQAITWLLDTVIDTIKAFVGEVKEGVKAGVQAIKEWWKKRKPFKTKSGESHILYTTGSQSNLKFMVASVPTDYPAFLTSISIKNDDPKKAEKKAAKKAAKTVFAELVVLSKALSSSNKDQGKQQQSTDFDEKLTILAEHTAILMDGAGSMPMSSPPVYGGLTSAGYGTSMFVPRLTKKGPKGSSPASSLTTAGFEKLNQRKTASGKGSFYIKGHLLNDNVHGPGNTWKNLTPLTRWANNNDTDSHLNAVEKFVKEQVNDKERIVEYKIQAIYDRSLKSNLITALESGTVANKEVKKQIIKAEAQVPSKLIANASIIGVTKAEDKEKIPNKFISQVIVNNSKRIDEGGLENYFVDGEAAAVSEIKKLAVNDERKRSDRNKAVKALSSNIVSGIGSKRINLILDTPGPKSFTSWDSMKERIQAYAKSQGEDDTNAATAATSIKNAFANNDKVTLQGKTEWE